MEDGSGVAPRRDRNGRQPAIADLRGGRSPRGACSVWIAAPAALARKEPSSASLHHEKDFLHGRLQCHHSWQWEEGILLLTGAAGPRPIQKGRQQGAMTLNGPPKPTLASPRSASSAARMWSCGQKLRCGAWLRVTSSASATCVQLWRQRGWQGSRKQFWPRWCRLRRPK